MPPYKFSATGMSLLEECQRCFWLQHNKGIKRPEGIFPSLPSGMDKILKTHFDSFMEKGKLPPELKDIDDVKLFDNRELLEEWRNNRKGIIQGKKHIQGCYRQYPKKREKTDCFGLQDKRLSIERGHSISLPKPVKYIQLIIEKK